MLAARVVGNPHSNCVGQVWEQKLLERQRMRTNSCACRVQLFQSVWCVAASYRLVLWRGALRHARLLFLVYEVHFTQSLIPLAESAVASALVAREQWVLTLPSEQPIAAAVSATSMSSQ